MAKQVREVRQPLSGVDNPLSRGVSYGEAFQLVESLGQQGLHLVGRHAMNRDLAAHDA